MTAPTELAGLSFEQLVFGADALREQIGAAVDRAIAAVDPADPKAAATRSALFRIAATLDAVPLTKLAKLAVVDEAMNGAILATIRATLDAVGPAPLLGFADAAEMLGIFDQLLSDAAKPCLH